MMLSDERTLQFRRIKFLFLRNYTMQEIHQIEGVSLPFLRRNFKHHIQKEYVPVLGHKSEAYFDENDLLNPQVYTYESLSDSEKEIYHSLCGEC